LPREISSGGVLVRRLKGDWVFAAIRPNGKPPGVWALPKGLVHRGESPDETALREVHEETGAEGLTLAKLGDVKYVYTRAERGSSRSSASTCCAIRAAAWASSRRTSTSRLRR
jgi:8-oxo-dGTP pyrophosphatase MutT (NUDIX family)